MSHVRTSGPRATTARIPAPRPPSDPSGLPPLLRGWRGVLAHPRFTVFHRLVGLVLAGNLMALVWGLTAGQWWRDGTSPHLALSRLVVVDLGLAVLIRNQQVVNVLYALATNAPRSWPLAVRRSLGKIYHLGGLHVGGALAGTVWFAVATAALLQDRATGGGVSAASVVVSQALVLLLGAIVVLAAPGRRARAHDDFELSHRFGGWAAIALFWAQTVLVTRDLDPGEPLGAALAGEWSVWLLGVLTLSVAWPWLRLRRVPVRVEAPSPHVAVASFGYGLTPRVGYGFAMSRRPLREWHAFASVPRPGEEGFRMVVSRAGDWTGSFVDDAPGHVWVRGVPTAGMAKVERLFRRVVFVATGSGIGPCLPFLLARRSVDGQAPAHLVWSTRDARGTYGDALVDEVLGAVPGALIWDTGRSGRPDLLALAHAAQQRFRAEAVVVVANQKLTRQVVHGLERRGIPAFGAIWDS